jgi:hypothetical protein
MGFRKGSMLAKLHSYGLLDNDTNDIAETHKKKQDCNTCKETDPSQQAIKSFLMIPFSMAINKKTIMIGKG